MSKPIPNTTVIREDFEVSVEPEQSFCRGSKWYTEEEMIRACNDIKSQIDRHVDGIASCIVQWKTLIICDFCKYDYEEDEEGPCCCDEAVEAWGKRQEKTATTEELEA